ncbi:hypothetical protein QKY98_14815 [Pseudomonas sp. HR1]|uniref:hypothetical protein n=1 Tax=Pseudomonas TaxID=286 RepID=UPI0025430FC5|nr:hypothetical protein [Pseudomonas sp. HR1]MDK4200400.1 hypothetical protein [Pseudomonas sp. HR1]
MQYLFGIPGGESLDYSENDRLLRQEIQERSAAICAAAQAKQCPDGMIGALVDAHLGAGGPLPLKCLAINKGG